MAKNPQHSDSRSVYPHASGSRVDTPRDVSETGSNTDGSSGGRKPRRAGIKYTNIVRSEYRPAPDGQTLNLLDERCQVVKGKVVIPGILAKNQFGEPLILVPSTATAFREPTLRQLLAYLQSLDAK